jgi:autotransporter-associated beta strand protein
MGKSNASGIYVLLKRSSYTAVALAVVTALALTLSTARSYAGSATWNLNPTSGDWNTAVNWTPPTVPNGSGDTATFSVSNVTNISLSAQTTLDGIVYEPGSSAFTINVSAPRKLTFVGVGITNNSGTVQNFATNVENTNSSGVISFTNSATAGSMTVFTNNASPQQFDDGGATVFSGSASAGSALFINNGAPPDVSLSGGRTEFHDNSTAANGVFINNPNAFAGGFMEFYDTANAGNGTFTCFGGMENAAGGSTVFFNGDSSAANGTFFTYGPTAAGGFPGFVVFNGPTTADHATFTAYGGAVNGEQGGQIVFFDTSTAADGTFVIEGTSVSGAEGGSLSFDGDSTAGNATIVINGGEAGGGDCTFADDAIGGTAQIQVFGNATVTDATDNRPPLTLGSIEGDGTIIGTGAFNIGSNNFSTVFSGVINAFGPLGKVGTGTLTLTGANSYRGGTTVGAGTLIAGNMGGSATGTGAVNVNIGTLGGSGIIAGATTIGTGSGSGAFLAPAAGTNVQATLTIQSALTFKADATYTCTFRAKRNRARTDKVIANGVTINSGALIALSGQTQGALRQGLVLTVISNTSVNPISGTFSNLPDGGIVTINGNNLQASYEGGDGNDLTLTVVP